MSHLPFDRNQAIDDQEIARAKIAEGRTLLVAGNALIEEGTQMLASVADRSMDKIEQLEKHIRTQARQNTDLHNQKHQRHLDSHRPTSLPSGRS